MTAERCVRCDEMTPAEELDEYGITTDRATGVRETATLCDDCADSEGLR